MALVKILDVYPVQYHDRPTVCLYAHTKGTKNSIHCLSNAHRDEPGAGGTHLAIETLPGHIRPTPRNTASYRLPCLTHASGAPIRLTLGASAETSKIMNAGDKDITTSTSGAGSRRVQICVFLCRGSLPKRMAEKFLQCSYNGAITGYHMLSDVIQGAKGADFSPPLGCGHGDEGRQAGTHPVVDAIHGSPGHLGHTMVLCTP